MFLGCFFLGQPQQTHGILVFGALEWSTKNHNALFGFWVLCEKTKPTVGFCLWDEKTEITQLFFVVWAVLWSKSLGLVSRKCRNGALLQQQQQLLLPILHSLLTTGKNNQKSPCLLFQGLLCTQQSKYTVLFWLWPKNPKQREKTKET